MKEFSKEELDRLLSEDVEGDPHWERRSVYTYTDLDNDKFPSNFDKPTQDKIDSLLKQIK